MVQKIPPPPPIANEDPTFNRWLLELTNILNAGGLDLNTLTAPTAAPGTNTNQIATCAFVLANGGGGATPSNSNPLMDGTAAPGTSVLYSRGDHVHPTDTSRAPLASPAFTGSPTGPTAAPGANNTVLATTAYVFTAVSGLAPLASPAFTGTPTAPTATAGTNTTQIATTAFVQGILASPAFTGTPTAPTAAPGTNTTQLATTAFVTAAIAAIPGPATATPLVDSGSGAVGTSLLYARQDHVHPTDTTRAPLASPAFTGTPTAPTPSPGDNSTNIATTAFVVASFAPLAGPNFTGVPTAPTAGPGTNTTQLATTAFVEAAVAGAAGVVMPGYIFGCTLSTAGGSGTFAVASGSAADSTNAFLIQTPGLSKTTAAFAAGNANGALDTGAIAATTWYHVFLIENTTAHTSDVLISLSPTAPTLPTGFNVFRRIGSMSTDASSHWILFKQNGNEFLWDVVVTQAFNPGTTAIQNVIVSTPLGIQCDAIINAIGNGGATHFDGRGGIWSPDQNSAGALPGSAFGLINFGITGTIANYQSCDQLLIRTDTNHTVKAALVQADGSADITTAGWIDTRGSGVVSGGTGGVNNLIFPGLLFGLTLSTAGSVSTFSVAAGNAVNSTATTFMTLNASVSKTTAAFAAGSGNGALDTGTIAASTWYHVFLIQGPTGGVDILISLSPTAPTLPSGFTAFRRLGSMRTDASSHWILFHQLGNEFLWDTPLQDGNNVTLTSTAATLQLTVPTGVQVHALLNFLGEPSVNTDFLITSFDTADILPAATDFTVVGLASQLANWSGSVRTNTSGQVRWRASGSSAGTFMITYGWIDDRGSAISPGGTQPQIPQGYIFGLTLSTPGASTGFSVAAGQAADSTNASLMNLTSAFSKTTAAFSAGTGNGALDTGAIAASTWYHVHLIFNPVSATTDVLISLSAAAPTLPSGFTLFRRIGAMKTNASSQWILFQQFGNEFIWDAPVGDVNSVVLTTGVATLFTMSVPPGVTVRHKGNFAITNGTAGGVTLVTSPLTTGAQTANAPSGNGQLFSPTASTDFAELETLTNTSAQVRVETGTASTTFFAVTVGWIDYRGGPFTAGGGSSAPVPGLLFGLGLSAAGAVATFGVATGQATDSLAAVSMSLTSAFTKTTSAFAAGSGNGALDTGTIAASTWYHVFLIESLSSGAVDVLVSLSTTAPTMPAGFGAFRRIGSMKTDASSHWIAFHQYGDRFLWDTPISDVATTVGTTSTAFTLSTPLGIVTEPIINIFGGISGGSAIYFVKSPNAVDVAPSAASAATFTNFTSVVSGSAWSWINQRGLVTGLLSQIDVRAGAAATNLNIGTWGYFDRRGQDSIP